MRWFLGRLLTSFALLSVLAMGGAVATSTGRGLSPMLGALRGSDSAPPVPDALAELVLVTRGHVHLVATKIAAAAPA